MCGGVPKEKGKWLGYKNGFEKAYEEQIGIFWTLLCPIFGSKWRTWTLGISLPPTSLS